MREITFRGWWDDGRTSNMLYVGDSYGTEHPLDCCTFLIQRQPITLMQFTGLIDKKGIPIYEGDIVSACFVWGCIGGVVKYFDDAAAFGIDNADEQLFAEHSNGIWEVLGNVYENPELLEAEYEE